MIKYHENEIQFEIFDVWAELVLLGEENAEVGFRKGGVLDRSPICLEGFYDLLLWVFTVWTQENLGNKLNARLARCELKPVKKYALFFLEIKHLGFAIPSGIEICGIRGIDFWISRDAAYRWIAKFFSILKLCRKEGDKIGPALKEKKKK